MNRLMFIFTSLVALFLLSSCMTQVSSLNSYNGPWRDETNQCQVYRTSLDSKFYEIVQKNEESLLGDSHVSTNGSYESVEAAYDCMVVGAKSVMILDRGVVSSSTSYVPGQTNYHYNPYTNTYTSVYTPGYSVSKKTSGYVVVFFSKDIPYGSSYTMDDYKTWKSKNGIVGCEGC